MLDAETFSKSLWIKTAVPNPELYCLNDDLETEIVIVGAGFTGLSAALHLLEIGHKVTIIEAHEVGFGGSGRNGGQVNPGLKLSPAELAKRFGQQKAKAIFRSTEKSVDLVFDLVKKYKLNCELKRTGFLFASQTKKMLSQTEKRFNWLREENIDVEMLDAKETSRRVGHNIYCGSLYDKRGGALQPLSYVRELARVVLSKGGSIFTQSPVLNIQKNKNKWCVFSKEGKVTSDKVLLCTNAYSDLMGNETLWPGLSRSLVPVFSFQVATEPLTDNLRSTILPANHTVSDTRRLMLYYRYDHEGRFVIGGRGKVSVNNKIKDYQHLINKVSELFPLLKDHKIDSFWSGKVAITSDGLPHIHNPSKGIFAGVGLNGRGVAMGTLLGKWLAEAASDKFSSDAIPFTKIKPIPLHRWRSVGINLITQFKSLQDRLGI